MADNYGEPQSRNEAILQNILGEDNELLEPVSRIEVLLTDLLDLLEQEALPSGTNDGDILAWDDTNKKWVAKPAGEVIPASGEFISRTPMNRFAVKEAESNG